MGTCESCENFSFYNFIVIMAKILFFLSYIAYIVSSRTSKGKLRNSQEVEMDQIISVMINQLFIILSISGAFEEGLGLILTLFNFAGE